VLGISNGGLIAAEIIARELYRGTPLLALWQHRWRKDNDVGDKRCLYFDHPTNVTVVEVLRNLHPPDAPILLIDDVIYRGTTTLQAIYFLEKHLGPHDLLLTPVFCRDTAYLGPLMPFLPPGYKGGSIFGITAQTYYSVIRTPKSFPYKVF
jgi:pyrimidine operon attenuation protein/uracil phosphoribosyltransferase